MQCSASECSEVAEFLYFAPGHILRGACKAHGEELREQYAKIGYEASFVDIEDVIANLGVEVGPELLGLAEGETEAETCRHRCSIPVFEEGRVAFYQCKCGEFYSDEPPGN